MPSRAACRRLWKALGALLGCRWHLETLPGHSWGAPGGLPGRCWAAPGSFSALWGGRRRPPGQLSADFFGPLVEICVADPWEGRKCIKKRSFAAWDASVFERVVVASLGAFWHHGRTDGHWKKKQNSIRGSSFFALTRRTASAAHEDEEETKELKSRPLEASKTDEARELQNYQK